MPRFRRNSWGVCPVDSLPTRRALLPGWVSTGPNFEVWTPGTTETPPGSTEPYRAAEGRQWIELETDLPQQYTQSFATDPGSVILIEAYHRVAPRLTAPRCVPVLLVEPSTRAGR